MVSALLKWVSSTIPSLIILVGALSLFNAVAACEDYRKLRIGVRAPIHFASIWVGALVLILGVVVFVFGRNTNAAIDFSPAISISGRWEYIVYNKAGDQVWSGECRIENTSQRSVTFRGTRWYHINDKVDERCYENVRIPWESTWAEVCEDGRVRCEYTVRGLNVRCLRLR